MNGSVNKSFLPQKKWAQAIQQALFEREKAGDIQIEEGVILPHLEHPALAKNTGLGDSSPTANY